MYNKLRKEHESLKISTLRICNRADILMHENALLQEQNKNYDSLVNELCAEISRLDRDLKNQKQGFYETRDWRIAYVPVYKEFPFPTNSAEAIFALGDGVEFGTGDKVKPIAIVRIRYYPGQIDRE